MGNKKQAIKKNNQANNQDEILDSLRKSLPSIITVEDFKDKIIKHRYITINYFNKLKTSHDKYNWAKKNVMGELYEALVSEALFDWAKNINDVNQFVLKNPYVKTKQAENGFGYDQQKITLFGDANPLAEFDALFQYKDKWVFVEITITTLRKNIKEFLQDVARKRKILKLIFNCDEIYSLLITIEPNLFQTNELTNFDLNCYFPINEDLSDCIPKLTMKGKYIKLTEKNRKFILANDLEFHDFEYKKMQTAVRKQFNKYYKGKITADEFLERIGNTIGLVQNITLGVLENTAINDLFNIGLLMKNYDGFSKEEVKRVIVGIKLKPAKKAELRLYVIPEKTQSNLIEAFLWKDNQFRIRKKVIKKRCILQRKEPKFNHKDKIFWSQLGKACDELKIPKLKKS